MDRPDIEVKQQQVQEGKLNLADLVQTGMCTNTTDTKELSSVGPYLSVKKDLDNFCPSAAHPSNSHDVNTTRNGKPVTLTDIFKSKDVFEALMNDRIVKDAMKSVGQNPHNLDEFKAVFSNYGSINIYEERPDKEPVSAELNANALDHFAFHHLDGNKVAVRLKLDPSGEADRNIEDYLGILLPVPPELKQDFRAAESGKKGFLMKDSPAKGKATHAVETFPDEPFITI
jgi:hypothetical protein